MDPGDGAEEEEPEDTEEGDVNPEEVRKIKKRIQSKEDQVSKEISVPAAAEEIQNPKKKEVKEEKKAKRA